MTLGKRIQKARRRLRPKVGQQAIADIFGITKQAVSQWERDEDRPSRERIPELAKKLKVPVLWLLSGQEDPPPENDILVRLEAMPARERATLGALIDAVMKEYGYVA